MNELETGNLAGWIAKEERLAAPIVVQTAMALAGAAPTATASNVPEEMRPKPVTTPRKGKNIEDVLGEMPQGSVELKLYQGKGAGLLTKDIESRVEWLQDATRSKRLFSAAYKRLVIAYLQEELGRRRAG